MVHIPVLRRGQPYKSLNTIQLPDIRTGETVAEVSQANAGLIARDLNRVAEARRALESFSTAELVEMSGRAAELFLNGDLPLGDGTQSAGDYIRQLSATTGLPESLAAKNMTKSHFVLANMEQILGGLTRGMDLGVLDKGWGVQGGRPLSFRRETDVLGAVLPSNSPGVHALWLPAIALKVTLALKPGRQEPWTPHRICQAFMTAGCPPEALGFYPTDYAGAGEILLRTGRSLLFGDASTVAPWKGDPRVEIHGPGWSKVVLAGGPAESWSEHVELMASSVADNGGRSCINASGVWTTSNGRELAAGLAERLARVEARPLDDPEAALAAFPSLKGAEALSDYIDNQLRIPGAEDMTAHYRSGGRVAEAGGCVFMLPTVIYCSDASHPLAQAEFLFPFVSVVEAARDDLVERMGPTLVLSALTDDPAMQQELLTAVNVERLNLGNIPTSHVSWDQPHEGNLFEHLYRQRAIQGPEIAA
jgi:acyl-CoA reductase-like NAD-dependent aldehyde dehydrogenase